MLAEHVVPTQQVGSGYLVWSVAHARTLRERYGIVGSFVGPFSAHKQQNDQLGLPLRITAQEAAVLLAEGKIAIFQADKRTLEVPNTRESCQSVAIEDFLLPAPPSQLLLDELGKGNTHGVPANVLSVLLEQFYVTSGLKFGCHLLLYPGDPLRYHASHMFIYLPRQRRLTSKEMIAFCRLGTHVKKSLMVGSVDFQGRPVFVCMKWCRTLSSTGAERNVR